MIKGLGVPSPRLPIGDFEAGADAPFFLIAGPCVIESPGHCLELADRLKTLCRQMGVPLLFKASFDKANRSSIHSYRGPGLEKGMEVLARVKRELGLPLISDVHEAGQIAAAAEVLDVIQIPAFLCRQTDLLVAAAASGKVVNVKKGQFLSPRDVDNIVEKAKSVSKRPLLVTERGVSFGYNNLIVDFKSIPWLRSLGTLAIFDATHSVQLPGGAGTTTAGQSEFIPYLARAAAGVGIDGLFLEVHEAPDRALSDGPNALPFELLRPLLGQVKAIDALVKGRSQASA